jgi:DNA repair protein RadD
VSLNYSTAQFLAAATLAPIGHAAMPMAESLLPPTLRDYQLDMLLEAARLMRAGYRRILLQLPTGGGKTVMAAALLGSASHLGYSAQFIVHRKELIKQTSATFTAMGIEHSFVAAKLPFDPSASIHLAGVQTLVNRLANLFPPNLKVIDEAHHAAAATWATVLAADPDAYIIGLSATPERLDGRGLDDHFDVMVLGPPVSWLIQQGWLSPFEFYAPDDPDMSEVPTHGGDFAKDPSAEVVDKPHLIGSIVEHYLRLAPGEQGIVFAANREHSRHIAAEFNAQGIPAMHVDGEMSDTERDWFDDSFRAGDTRIGVNVALFDEGYDVPNISYVGDGAPSRSMVKVRQRWGRDLRMAPGKTRAIICDHAGNALRLGDLPDTDRDWSLQGKAARKRNASSDDAEPIRQCTVCFRVSYSKTKVCPGCGAEYGPTKREIEQRDGELRRLEQIEQKKREKDEVEACRNYRDFHDLALKRGYENPDGWARMRRNMQTGRFFRGR